MTVHVMPVRAGDVLTAHGYNLAQPVYSWRTASKPIASSTTLTADEELWTTLEPFATYTLLVCLAITGGTTGDFKINYATPTGSQGRRHCIGPVPAVTSATGNTRHSVNDWSVAVNYGTFTSSLTVRERGIISTEATGGVLQAQWAQNTSSATATVVEASSFLRVQRVL
ncbi:hypothetical protein [Glycomyces artemisiae]|uniref:Uncharacterized protein n=1 Tax=Glycomyces artemisiae TaxID=1076443 RepID=A0A2T0UEQ9_9ACTN|nr:hypothetical protein [Glycomyces artemisiae]PRY56431.1 hypothetical protein B0I28_10980 [Glycomyces artemisiae]